MGKLFLSLLLSLTLAAPAIAANTNTPAGTVRDTIKEQREQMLREIKEAREQSRREIQERREAFKRDFEDRREALRQELEKKREELKTRLQKIADEQKKSAVQKIDAALDALNERRLRHYSAVLEQIEKVLERIDKRIEQAESRGLDVVSVKAAEEAAKTAIAKSREAIKAQAAKTYKATITTEGKLKADVGSARKALHTDLKTVEATVKAAREAVKKAATTLAQIPRVDEPVSPTSTPPATQ